MTIESLSKREVVVIDEARNAQDAARAMRDHHVGAIVVVRGEGRAMRLVGVVTDRDIAMAVAADGHGPELAIRTLARHPTVTISHKASVCEAAAIMRSAAVRRLVVIDEHRHMVGIVSLDDVLAAAADLFQDLSGAISGRREREAVDDTAEASRDATHAPLLVSPDLAATWRRVFQP
jgi:CBS domain-containing protein